jgi:AraC-like DNA-binding protein
MDRNIQHQAGLATTGSIALSNDIEETIGIVSQHLGPHKMTIAKPGHGINAHMGGVFLDTISILDLQYGANVNITPNVNDAFLIHMPLSGNSKTRYGKRTVECSIGTIVISEPAKLSHVYMDKHSRHLTAAVSANALTKYLAGILGHDIRAPLQFNQKTSNDCPAGSSWLQTVTHLFTQAKVAPQLFENSRLSEQYISILMEILLSMFNHSYSDQLKNKGRNSAPWHVKQAKDYIEENISESINMSELSSFVGVCARTLQNGFRQFEAVSPAEYIRERRLQLLHQALQSAEPNKNNSITDIMLNQGISSFGRYAHYYQLRYDCLPSETLKKQS